jgi:sugar phosphate isomerase/epimerase
MPRLSISQITTVGATLAEDVAAYRAAGCDGLGIWETKLEGDDEATRTLLRDAGLAATHCVPAVPSILPLPLLEGPLDAEERIEAICASVRRLAVFEPACVLFLTGPNGPHATVVEGVRRIARAGREAGVRVALEPVQRLYAELWTIVSDVGPTLELLHEADADELGVMVDTWHLWNSPTLLDDLRTHVDRVAGVHVADWREPTRNTSDRAFPGEGTIDLPAILRTLHEAGYEGWYDVEIFSDVEEDSLWALPAEEAARRARAGFDRVWAIATAGDLDATESSRGPHP